MRRHPAPTGRGDAADSPAFLGAPIDDAAVEAVGLRRSFPSGVALQSLDLQVGHGEVLALLGPNGAGKTTTVRLFNGVLRPDAGFARIHGVDPQIDGDRVRRSTGVMTENAGLDDRLTARENVLFAATLRGIDRDEGARRAAQLLAQFEMADLADVRVNGFSTGQRKRVALARSLIHDPQVLFLDEPTSGLDPAATRDVLDLIASLARDRGRTVILCTHFLGEAGRLADRVAVLDRGRLRASGTVDELAAALLDGTDLEVTTGRVDDTAIADLVHVPGVLRARRTDDGIRATVESRDAAPLVTRALVRADVDVYGVTLVEPTVEEIYFAVEAGRLTHPTQPEPVG